MHKMGELLRTASLSKERNDLQTCQYILQALWNVCADQKAKELAITLDLIGIISSLVIHPNTETRRLATGCLMALSVAERGKAAIIQSAKAIEYLCMLALDDQLAPSIRVNTLETLRNAIEDSQGLHAAGAILLKRAERLYEIFGAVRTARVIQPLFDDRKYHFWALQALTLLCQKDDASRQAAWSILEIIPKLVKRFASDFDESVRAMASRCVLELSAQYPDALAQFQQVLLDSEAKAAVVKYCSADLAQLIRSADPNSVLASWRGRSTISAPAMAVRSPSPGAPVTLPVPQAPLVRSH